MTHGLFGRRRAAASTEVLRGGTLVVTGGTSGIGRALVDGGVERGMRVLTCGRNSESLAALRLAHGSQVTAVYADLSTPNALESFGASVHTVTHA